MRELRCKRLGRIIVLAFILTLIATSALAGGEEKYNAIYMDRGVAFVIDTKEGHCWIVGAGGDSKGAGMLMIYMGKVRPRKKMGEIIDTFQTSEKPGKEGGDQ